MQRSILPVLACGLALSAQADTKPNIVYILADDLGYGDVKCLNPERCKIATPHMDRLAAEGMIFTDAHTSSSVCTPTRYGILTGRYNWRTMFVTHNWVRANIVKSSSTFIVGPVKTKVICRPTNW